jgi:hypothetical protein
MAGVFTDIGLPVDYEQAREGYFTAYVEKLGQQQ